MSPHNFPNINSPTIFLCVCNVFEGQDKGENNEGQQDQEPSRGDLTPRASLRRPPKTSERCTGNED